MPVGLGGAGPIDRLKLGTIQGAVLEDEMAIAVEICQGGGMLEMRCQSAVCPSEKCPPC
jgi:hypothetical protein